jgi:hypothetical protein
VVQCDGRCVLWFAQQMLNPWHTMADDWTLRTIDKCCGGFVKKNATATKDAVLTSRLYHGNFCIAGIPEQP